MILKNFVVFEGLDGSGTSTQLNLLSQKRTDPTLKRSLHITCEPADGPIGRLIRSVLRGESKLCPESLARLFSADRHEHIHGHMGILEYCEQGYTVICDRYTLSSLVYQGIECGEDLPHVLNSGFPRPELLFFFDIDPDIAQKRYQNRDTLDVYEYPEFQKKVRDRYISLLDTYCSEGTKLITLDATLSVEKIHQQIWKELQGMPIHIV